MKKKPGIKIDFGHTLASVIAKALPILKKAQAHVPTDREFRTAVTELCGRYRDALDRWGRYKVHFRPRARKKKDQERHALLWAVAENAKHDLATTATGLLGLHSTDFSNAIARGRLPELLKAAAARRAATPKGKKQIPLPFAPESAVILGTALLLRPKRKGKR